MAIRIPKQIPTIIPVDAEKIYKHIIIHANYRLLLAHLKSSLKCFTHIQDKNTFSINTQWSLFGSQVVIPKHTQMRLSPYRIALLLDCLICCWLLYWPVANSWSMFRTERIKSNTISLFYIYIQCTQTNNSTSARRSNEEVKGKPYDTHSIYSVNP